MATEDKARTQDRMRQLEQQIAQAKSRNEDVSSLETELQQLKDQQDQKQPKTEGQREGSQRR